MHTIIWRYAVQADRAAEFERHYAADGTWAQLFRKSPDYLGTELFRDAGSPTGYLTLDHWKSEAAFAAFKSEHADEYKRLDAGFEDLTASEERLGAVDA